MGIRAYRGLTLGLRGFVGTQRGQQMEGTVATKGSQGKARQMDSRYYYWVLLAELYRVSGPFTHKISLNPSCEAVR